MTPRFKSFAILLLVLLFPQIIVAQTASQPAFPWAMTAFSADAAAMQKLAATVPAGKYDPVTVFLDERAYSFDAANRLTVTRHLIYRVNTPDGLNSWSTTGGGWEPWHEKRPEVRARVITPDGQEHTLDAATLKDSPARDDVPETYSDDRVYGGPLPAMTAGVIVEEQVVNQDTEPIFAGGYTKRLYVGKIVPVMYTRVVLEAPHSLPLHYQLHLLPDAKVQKEDSGGVIKVTIEQGEMDGLERAEPNLPSDVPDYPQVEFATGRSWKEVADNYGKMSELSIKPDEVKALVAKEARKGASREETIRKIVAQLHANVRYTGIEFGEAKLVPESPANVLKRKYGDCKDKATMLVSMLRAAKIPAYLALLELGPGQDVNSDLPGMGLFDHAIVYVPGKPDLWIDATAEFAKVGDVPYGDQGRQALIIREGTEALTRTPEMLSRANVMVETREFHLAEYGPAKIAETSEGTGSIDAAYRSVYGKPETKETHQDLENYVKSTYLADSLTKVEHGDGMDMTKPFQLRLEMDKGNRGYTGLNEAVVVVSPYRVIARLPQWMLTTEEEKDKKSDDAEGKPKKKRTDDVVFEPFVTEWRYEVTVPADFQLRGLPKDKTTTMGPAVLTEHFERKGNGALAVLRFDTVKGRYSPAEVEETRKAVKQFYQTNYTMLTFDQIGASLVAAGKVPEGLQSFVGLIKAEPKTAIFHVRYANALLKAGVGDHAKEEAKLATELDPKAPEAFASLGWVLEHDSIGRRFAKGFDWAGAVAAYRKAKELDPKGTEVRENLGILLEYAEDGSHYTSIEHLAESEKEYRELATVDEKEAEAFKNNLLYVLLYQGKYKEIREEVAKGNGTAARNGLAAASVAMMDGLPAALQYVDQIGGGANERNAAINNAAARLVDIREYQMAAQMLDEVAKGQEDSSGTSAKAESYRRTKRYEEVMLPETDPRSVIQRYFEVGLRGHATVGEMRRLNSKYGFVAEDDETVMEQLHRGLNDLQGWVENSGLSAKTMTDITISQFQYSVEGSDETGYRIGLRKAGRRPDMAYVVKEDGVYKLLGLRWAPLAIGKWALELVREKKLAAARTWLDWQREAQSLQIGDDPLGGAVFPRLWTKGMQGDESAIRSAAASLVAWSLNADEVIGILREASTNATTAEERTKYDLALAAADHATENWKELQEVALRLLKVAPNSPTALQFLMWADYGLKDWTTWEVAIKGVTSHSDPELTRVLARQAEAAGNYAKSRVILRSLIDSGRGTSSDMNSLAWVSLFEGKVDKEAVEMGQQSNAMTQGSNAANLHTLACVYAETGNYSEAQQLLLSDMRIQHMQEADSSIWYGFGRLYERYGETKAAIAAYKKVELPKGPLDPVDTYRLAQKGLQRLGQVKE